MVSISERRQGLQERKMAFDLTNFGLSEMLRCGLDLRRLTASAGTMEEAANAIVRYLYDQCIDPRTGERTCVLVRFYKTHPYGALQPEQRQFATRMLGGGTPSDSMRCLTLLASAGDEPAWNSRVTSRGHMAIPLPSTHIVQQAPMIAQLVKQMGMDLAQVVSPSPQVIADAEGKSYNVFYVDDAVGSPYIPAQEEFVIPYRVRSVVGFGGLLRSGELCACILFSRVSIPRDSADRFRTIALDVRSRIFLYRDDQVFAPAPDA